MPFIPYNSKLQDLQGMECCVLSSDFRVSVASSHVEVANPLFSRKSEWVWEGIEWHSV